MRFKERNDLANRCKEWVKDQQNNITAPLDNVHMVLAYLDVNGYLNKVVRCKNCKHSKMADYIPAKCPYYCKLMANCHSGDFFCSMGERREDEDDIH